MPQYLVTYDEKGPILYGPYPDVESVLRKQGSLEDKRNSEIFDLPTNNRQRAARMIKEKSTGLVNFKYG